MPKKNQKISSDRIYDFIIKSIKDGKLKPNDRVKEQDLVEQTGLSRTPIREALGLLQNDGILVQDGKNGLIVAGLDLISITKLYEIRELLEGEAAKLAALHASMAEIEILVNILKVQKNIKELNELRASNILFHQTLYRCSGNHYLFKIMENLDRSLLLLGDSTLAKENRPKEAYEEHLAVVNAIKEKNALEAERLAKFHIQQAYKIRLDNILKK
ncbi:GntR family transcriptional regulator [Campylobacter jejuni]|uniref:FCD domain-containing protein n=1 Tax=Campylobacter jejuni TaxID=197 RepID=A0A690VAF6_CAMJU|nr:GntR family transcriptional regulator [Campylobacter jejuni]EAJ5194607.1 GntR family transcriptional regulator [Campylobacter jejuni]EAK0574245.1 GntR family transcriptional regulator [Campylobacter jejuni]EDP7703194.1 FCD domain-containing protein [Campylobacter jejuni]EDP8234050.1 FCD domain-containing protein [Campylobacter jejuni]EFV4334009.1 GntR family transcriptional regulator [Campylobacter jejuni]